VYLVVQSGAGDSEAAIGLAHYLEHLAWLNAHSGEAGGQDNHDSNAWTTTDETVFWETGATDQAGALIADLSGVLRPFTLAPQFMQQEKQVIAREYDLRSGDDPLTDVSSELESQLFAGGPRGRSVLGSRSDIAALELKDAIGLHARTYVASNATLLIFGDVDPVAAEAAIASAFPLDGVTPPAHKPFAMPPEGTLVTNVSVAGISQPIVLYREVFSLDAPVPLPRLMVAVGLLKAVLDSGLPGGVAKPLRFDAFVARDFAFAFEVIDASHISMTFSAQPDRGVTPQKLLASFRAALSATATTGIPLPTFERIQQRQIADLATETDPAMTTRNVALQLMSLRSTPISHEQIQEILASVTADELDGILQRLAGSGRLSVDLISPN
jgi:zinc protease